MHKYVLYPSLVAAVVLSLHSATLVSAQAVATPNPTSLFAAAVNRYQANNGTFLGAIISPVTKKGSITVQRIDDKLGAVNTTFTVTPQTTYLRKYGGQIPISEIRPGDDVRIYAQRNAQNTYTAITVTDNNVWLLDNLIPDATVTAIDDASLVITAKDAATGETLTIPYTSQTLFSLPDGSSGTVDNLTVGRRIKVRGIARKTDGVLKVEQSLVIFLYRVHGE